MRTRLVARDRPPPDGFTVASQARSLEQE